MSKISNKMLLEEFNVNQFVEDIKKHASEAKNEEELKIRVEILLSPIRKKYDIQWASYEHRHHISGKRKDALYGTVIIEYKTPGRLDSKSEFEKAKEQVKRYIVEEAKDPKIYGKYFGIILDGYKISFIRFKKNDWEEHEEPFEVNAHNMFRFLEALRGLRRKPIAAQEILIDFGPKSKVSKKAIQVLYNSLMKSTTDRTKMLFDDWRRVFSQVCAYTPKKLESLIYYYGLEDKDNIDVEKLFFATHTYYTLLMKLLTSEIVTLFADSLLGSYLKRLEDAYYKSKDEMFNELKELEEGGIFADVGIRNFLEADYFGWYLDAWNERIADSVFDIVKKLSDYEPATVELNPEIVKDLFKRLYQNLVPRTIRHKLGEYFTPDWLAELLLDEIGYDGNPDKRILDPACGSGTFLVYAIRRIREYADYHFLNKRELLTKIVNNVKGIDLNPLAILASKANYLIALSDLLRYRPKEGIDLPIYLADSISIERKGEWKWETGKIEEEFELHTTEGKFWIAKEVIDKNLLNPVLNLIEECIRYNFKKNEFEKLLSKDIPLSKASISSFLRLYEKIYKLEYLYHKNRIWTALLKNSFAPLLIGKFDYVIGNPPWINWDTLPEFFRNSTKHLWNKYGLLEKTKGIGLGKVKRDISMLFVTRCLSNYVKDGGCLSFLIPYTTYKTQAGAGFRRYLATECNVTKIHDLVTLYPFEQAINRTSLIIIKKDNNKTSFPISCVMWYNPKSKGIEQEVELDEVYKTTKQFNLILAPIRKGKPETPWMIISEKAYEIVQNVMEPSKYKAHAGVFTGVNSVYFISILSKQPNLFFIKNLSSIGRKNVKEIKIVIEPELVYPLARGRDHKKWHISPSGYILIPSNKKGETLSHFELKTEFPQTYKYFYNFFNVLINRKAQPFKSKLAPYLQNPIDKVEKDSPPFYWLFNVKHSLSSYKVLWKYIAGKISGKGEFSVAVMEPIKDKYVGYKTIIPNEKLMIIPFDERDEAYYVASILNCSVTQLIVMGYTIETAISTHVLNNIFIPKFNPNNKNHKDLSNLSKKAHKLAQRYYEKKELVALEKLKEVEEDNDKKVSELFGINEEELQEIKRTILILKEGKEVS